MAFLTALQVLLGDNLPAIMLLTGCALTLEQASALSEATHEQSEQRTMIS